MDFSKHTKYIYSTGTHYISNSGHDEKGKYTGGTAGDQTGDEWSMRSWYNRPWSVVLRYEKDNRFGILMANLSCAAALNNKIGYDQIQRTTYWTQLSKVGYDPSAIVTACEDDCTAGVTANAKACGYLLGIDSLKNLSTSIYSKTMKSKFVAAGFTALTASKYLTSSKYLLPGDVLLYEGHHAACNVTVGASVKSSYTAPDISGIFNGASTVADNTTVDTTTVTSDLTVSGNPIGTATAKQNMHIRKDSNASAESLTIVNAGQTVKVYELLSNGWMKVDYDGVIGYTSNRNNAYYTYTAASAAYQAKVNCSKLYVRKGPGTKYGTKRIITKDTQVTVYEEQNNFGRIGDSEWCSLKYLTKI